ncbi:uncharacterized protein LOC144100420 isoform X1 [Amblyomma americanum]
MKGLAGARILTLLSYIALLIAAEISPMDANGRIFHRKNAIPPRRTGSTKPILPVYECSWFSLALKNCSTDILRMPRYRIYYSKVTKQSFEDDFNECLKNLAYSVPDRMYCTDPISMYIVKGCFTICLGEESEIGSEIMDCMRDP